MTPKKLEDILVRIGSAANNLEHFGDEIQLGFCCDDCPGRTTKIVITAGEIRKLAKLYGLYNDSICTSR
jgi:hypothetical protein